MFKGPGGQRETLPCRSSASVPLIPPGPFNCPFMKPANPLCSKISPDFELHGQGQNNALQQSCFWRPVKETDQPSALSEPEVMPPQKHAPGCRARQLGLEGSDTVRMLTPGGRESAYSLFLLCIYQVFV